MLPKHFSSKLLGQVSSRTANTAAKASALCLCLLATFEISARKEQVARLAEVRSMPSLRRSLFTEWKRNPETCQQWINAQISSRSYLDAYIIGAQKSATSELSTRLYDLGVLHKFMRKEWFFLNNIQDSQPVYQFTALHRNFGHPNITSLRRRHFLAGFPHLSPRVRKDTDIPLVDDAPREERMLVYDASVENMLSSRVAFLAHSITPHAKIVLLLREPISRALSQYNMAIRLQNSLQRSRGLPEKLATKAEFDYYVRLEMRRLVSCGYDKDTGSLQGNTTSLLACMLPLDPARFDTQVHVSYVTRGLYHLHIAQWLRFFPAHRLHFMRFTDISSGNETAMQNLAEFLCVRPYTEQILKKYKDKASDVSFGVQAAQMKLDKWRGFDTYAGKDKYLYKMLPSTRRALGEFYKAANRRLEHIMGAKMF